MDARNEQFLKILKTALEGQCVAQEVSAADWELFIRQAQQHKVLPLLCEAAPQSAPPEVKAAVRRQIAIQTAKTHQFLQLNHTLRQAGLTPLVVKGIVCRELYPNPDSRVSSDEDVLLPEAQFMAGCEALERFGMQTGDAPEQYERAYRMQDNPLFIELHRQFFPRDHEAYGDWNRLFDCVFDRAVEEEYYGQSVLTLHPTDHMLYLICHAFKHFLHSGFGVRQVCDMVMYANARGGQIHWEQVLESCRQIRAHLFAAAVFRIGRNYLNFDPEKACYPSCWQELQVDELPLLEDLLLGGIYGGASESRKHSAGMTLGAVANSRRGKKRKGSVHSALFPSAKALKGRYPYLKKYPWLLPVAWTQRIVKYKKETAKGADNSAREAVQIGNQRLKLLRQYGVIS